MYEVVWSSTSPSVSLLQYKFMIIMRQEEICYFSASSLKSVLDYISVLVIISRPDTQFVFTSFSITYSTEAKDLLHCCYVEVFGFYSS